MIPTSEPDDHTDDHTSDDGPSQDEIDRIDPDSPARGVLDPDVEGPEPNEPA